MEVIRKLWDGKLTSHRGEHFTVENARLYSLPDEPPPLLSRWPAKARSKLALKQWPNSALSGSSSWSCRCRRTSKRRPRFDFYERKVLPSFA
jgi:hypothetical protein